MLAELLDALLGPSAPAVVRRTAATARARPITDEGKRARNGGVLHLASMLWRLFADRRALTAERALVLATRMARWIDDATLLHLFECEAASKQLEDARRALHGAVKAISPRFHARAHRLRIDRALLDRLDLGDRVVATFHDSGHLASLSVPGQMTPRLTLARTPGTGAFRDGGTSGGYGYATSESYAEGHASGTFFSPWHDGEQYRQPIAWLQWVVECAGAVANMARKSPTARTAAVRRRAVRPRSPRRHRRRR